MRKESKTSAEGLTNDLQSMHLDSEASSEKILDVNTIGAPRS